MPIEIKELHIKVTVNQPQSTTGSNTTIQVNNKDNSVKNEFLLEECVEQVMQILQNKSER